MLISFSTLRKFYKQNGITYKNVQYIRRHNQDAEWFTSRFAFCRQLSEVIYTNKHVIYFDETTVNSWINVKKTWAMAGLPLVSGVSRTRFSNTTIIGAIGKCLPGGLIYEIASSTNKQDVVSTLLTIRE